MVRLLTRNFWFFIPYLLFLLIGGYALFTCNQHALFYFFNGELFSGEDYFMTYYTLVGDGLFAVAVALFLAAFVKIRYGIIAGAAFILQGVAVQVLKQLIFVHRQRPWALYSSDRNLHVVLNYHHYTNNSFPSGHTTTAFGIFVLLTIFARHKWLGFIFFILALMVGYARIYLAQHFFADVYFGSILGTLISILMYVWLNSKRNFLRKYYWADKPITGIIGQ